MKTPAEAQAEGFPKFNPVKLESPGGRVQLREFKRSDVPEFNKILNEPEVNRFLLVNPPVALESTMKHYAKVKRDANLKWIAVLADGKLAGAIEWRRGRLKRSHVCGFNIIFSSASRGKGVAATAFQACLPFLRENGVEIISEDCFADNERARAFYAKLGFTEPALLKRRFKRGNEYVDEVIIEKIL